MTFTTKVRTSIHLNEPAGHLSEKEQIYNLHEKLFKRTGRFWSNMLSKRKRTTSCNKNFRRQNEFDLTNAANQQEEVVVTVFLKE